MAICKFCGQQLDDSASFCGKCGGQVTPEASPLVCSNCGNELQEGQPFCDRCGQRVEPAQPAPRPVPDPHYPIPVPPSPIPTPVPIPTPTPSPAGTDGKTLMVWTVVLAVLGPLLAWNWSETFGLVLCVSSIVLGVKSKKAAAIAAGIISAVVVLFMYIYVYA